MEYSYQRSYSDLEKSLAFDNMNLSKTIEILQIRIDKAIELLQKYNDKESNYYVPVDIVLDILKGEDK